MPMMLEAFKLHSILITNIVFTAMIDDYKNMSVQLIANRTQVLVFERK